MTPIDAPVKLYSEMNRGRTVIQAFVDTEYQTKEPSVFVEILYKTNRIKELYSYNNKDIEEYLKQNSIILDSLIVAHYKIREIFINNIAALELEIIEDHEEDYQQLFVVIKSSGKARELVNLLSNLHKQWYLDLSYDIRSKFAITLKAV